MSFDAETNRILSGVGTPLGVPPKETKATRCFVTGVTVVKPDFNRLISRVNFKADHAYSNGFEGSIEVTDGSKFAIGDVINVTIEIGDK